MKRFTDVIIILLLVCVSCGLAWLCSRTSTILHPNESDCIEQLRATTRRTTNYTQEEVVSYGRCLLERNEK